ncbi:hypothetical protein TNCV_462801 [Trichonephila clavipes]|nr:hypothetical protein TNCV_462801 [Trichonephila clavipes]
MARDVIWVGHPCTRRKIAELRITRGIGMMKLLGQTESGSTESNESVPSIPQHLYISESPFNFEVTPDAPTIDIEQQKSKIKIG